MPRLLATAMSVLVCLSFGLAAYSFWSGHEAACSSRNTSLDVMHDMIVIAEVPPPNRKLSKQQKQSRNAFNRRVFARINQARC